MKTRVWGKPLNKKWKLMRDNEIVKSQQTIRIETQYKTISDKLVDTLFDGFNKAGVAYFYVDNNKTIFETLHILIKPNRATVYDFKKAWKRLFDMFSIDVTNINVYKVSKLWVYLLGISGLVLIILAARRRMKK